MGVRRFSALPYAHKPGVATLPQRLGAGFAADVPESLWSATFYPEPEAAAYVARPGRRRRRDLQAAPAGGGVPPRRPAAATRCGARSRTPGCRSSCTPAPGRSATRSPGRRRGAGAGAVPAAGARGGPHGAPECEEFLRWPSATSGSASTPRWCSPTSSPPLPPATAAAARDLGDKVLLGTRLPDHPLPLRPPARGPGPPRARRRLAAAVCWDNGAALFGLGGTVTRSRHGHLGHARRRAPGSRRPARRAQRRAVASPACAAWTCTDGRPPAADQVTTGEHLTAMVRARGNLDRLAQRWSEPPRPDHGRARRRPARARRGPGAPGVGVHGP